MSEQAEQTDVSTAAAPPGPRQFTPEELAAARQQLLDQGELDPAPPRDAVAEDQADLGVKVLQSGAEADEIDPGELLAAIRALQSKVDGLEREKRLSQAPDVVKYATALHDHLTAKALANPVINADPDHGFGPVLEQTATLKDAAADAADSGHPGQVEDLAGKVGAWVSRHARHFPQIDYSYVLDLAEDVATAAAKLA
jgi:hypothetical protein